MVLIEITTRRTAAWDYSCAVPAGEPNALPGAMSLGSRPGSCIAEPDIHLRSRSYGSSCRPRNNQWRSSEACCSPHGVRSRMLPRPRCLTLSEAYKLVGRLFSASLLKAGTAMSIRKAAKRQYVRVILNFKASIAQHRGRGSNSPDELVLPALHLAPLRHDRVVRPRLGSAWRPAR